MVESRPRRLVRAARLLAVPTLAAAVVALLPVASTRPAQAAWTPLSPVNVTFANAEHALTAKGHLIAFNDFHGNIDPPSGSSGLVNGNPAGGVEYLASYVKKLRAQAQRETRDVYTVAAGDLVGAAPLVSAAFHDEPAIEEMNSLGLDVTSVGNHEYDEGVDELKRLQRGGCHPVDGCQDGDGFDGATFRYLAANVIEKQTGKPMLQPLDVKFVGGVPVAFVGMTLEGTPGIVNPAGIQSVTFKNEVETANQYADVLGRFLGIHAMVLLIHQGGSQQTTQPAIPDVSGCENFAGDITKIVQGLRPEYGIVVSGHTHRFYSCALPNSSGATSVVTSAGSFGTMVTDLSFTVDKRSRRFATASARNEVVLNGVRNPDGTWAKDSKGNFVRNPALVDAPAKAIADKYRTAVAPLANRVVGTITADISNAPNAAGESPLGDVIADGMLSYTKSAQAQLAFMNPGGIRTQLSYANSPGGEKPGEVTYGECFAVQPFNNLVVTQTYTGAQLKEVLEQQFAGYGGQTVTKFLQVSAGFTYSYDSTAPAGQRVSKLALNGVTIDPAAGYKVAMNDFLANGGDGFAGLTVGTGRVTAPGFDVDALVTYLGTGPIAPGPQNRITKLA
ncbi:bifunctional metallophosphatase/5'-nucleotidase [Planosporangium mesophilum]|uniref:Bifunctional metallophosphatase/5'-nucleotidase n=1 Tax=Planosporangium mesophilum TaxID=689768 RepID=A0A8J3T832_9ACTN|nr:bifunctional metallophosphatase/5'-nucleotidase [Planosporangium mesophilum]NJC81330.1 bifunctional metallophosphatase/5'-nucleotidase [Planosporangium mesophilum]GII21017.1 bifunctional metallophosphatase/5'-nucleotidase [Planosporangium mesophilum]